MYIYIYIGLVSLLNGISTFMGYLMPKLSLLKDNCFSILLIDAVLKQVNLNSSHAITFTFGLMPLGKVLKVPIPLAMG